MKEYEELKIIKDNKNIFSNVFISQDLPLNEATERYTKRRKDFIDGLTHPVIIFSNDREIGGEVWHSLDIPINQEPLMLYLTGINQSKCVLFMDPNKKKEILFVPKRNVLNEFWNGTTLGIDGEDKSIVKKLIGIEDVRFVGDMYFYLSDYIDEFDIEKIGVLIHDGYDIKTKKSQLIKDCNFRNFTELKKNLEVRGKNIRYFNILRYQFDKRLSLDDIDVNNIKKANEIHHEGLLKVWKRLKSLKNEMEVSGIIQGHFIESSPSGLAFSTIAGGGLNGTCLHYTKNDSELIHGELLVLDTGVKVGSVMNDVTRTFPVNGKFDPMQKILYNIVLDSQKEVEKKVKKGVLFWDLDEFVWQYIEDELKKRFVEKGGKYRLLYDKKPHGLGHLLGEMIHDGDVFRNYHKQPMEVGWVITNEPGLYGYFEIELDGKEYAQWIGIRLEDDLLVTENGCDNLSKMIPKEVSDIENLISN